MGGLEGSDSLKTVLTVCLVSRPFQPSPTGSTSGLSFRYVTGLKSTIFAIMQLVTALTISIYLKTASASSIVISQLSLPF